MDGMEYTNQKTSEANGRPEWAQGPEWDGWRLNGQGSQMCRLLDEAHWMFIYNGPMVELSYRFGTIKLKNVEAALAIANIIAEDRGGWA